MRNFGFFFWFILLILGWMSTFEIIAEAKSPAYNDKNVSYDIQRVTRSVTACKRRDYLQFPASFRVCQRRLTNILTYLCNTPYPNRDPTNTNNGFSNYYRVNQDIPNHSNVVDACCKNCCTEKQLLHYCKEFRTRSSVRIHQPQITPPQQEPELNSGPFTVGTTGTSLPLPLTLIPSFHTTLRGWNEIRPSEDMPTSSQMEFGGGENTESIDYLYNR